MWWLTHFLLLLAVVSASCAFAYASPLETTTETATETPVYSVTSTLVPEITTTTINNKLSSKASTEDLEFLCHHFYKDEFVIAADVLESGCKLECVFLKSSGDHGSNFFDSSVVKVHTLNEGAECDNHKVFLLF